MSASVNNGPLTTSLTQNLAPGLLRNEIDRRIVRVRPMATPLDQISRMSAPRRAGSMTVEYYSVDTKPDRCTIERSTYSADKRVYLRLDKPSLLQKSETVMLPGFANAAGEPLVGYVHDGAATQGVLVELINADDADTVRGLKLQDATLVRMGRAAGELDVQTPSFEALPEKKNNYCQIFKAQIEQSTLQRLSNKEVGWTFGDQEEVAVYDMRLGMEKSFLFGVKTRLDTSAVGGADDVVLTGGIWHQAGRQLDYSTEMEPSELALQLSRQAFVGSDSSRRKVLLAGSSLIEKLSRLDVSRTATARDVTSKWGLDFTELVTKFGRLYVIHSEVFDACGMPGNGMVIDPEYITKYSFIPMTAERLDLKRSGQRNTDAVVITEASCLVLRYPEAHVRVVATEPEPDTANE